ncbi:integrase, catalytic region, zinc finger, CCHC-type containing protein [Tanacetum coccineum]
MFLNMDQLQKQLDNNEFQEIGSMASFKVLETQFQMFIKSKIYLNDEYIVMTRNYFLEYTRLDILEFRDTLIQNMDYVKKSIEKRALHKMEYDSRVNERLMQTTEEKVDSSKALDASLVIIESNGTESQKQDTSSRSGNDAHVNDADIRPIYNEEPMAEVQTTDDNVSATGQQHTEQPEFNNEGKVDQNAEQCHDIRPLPAKLTDNMTTKLSDQSLESENVCLKNTVAQFQKDFSRMEAHCVNLELKYQNQALKEGQHGQFLKAKSNEAKIKHDIDVIETINIELEHKVAKLLKENETLKRHYKELTDSIKTMRAKTIKHTTSLIAKNTEFKAQLQEKGFAIAALKNELRKLKGNSVNTKFAKSSILVKLILHPFRNQSIVRQLTAFKSERPKSSKPRFASQVDVNNDLPKPVTTHYLTRERESAFVKPHHMIAPSSSRRVRKGYEDFNRYFLNGKAHGDEVSTEDANHITCTLLYSSTNVSKKDCSLCFADEVIYSLFAKQSKDWDLLHEDLEQIDDVDIEEMDINWQIAMIAIRMKKFYKETRMGESPWMEKHLLVLTKRSLNVSIVTTLVTLLGNVQQRGHMMERRKETHFINIKKLGSKRSDGKGKTVDSWKDSSKNLWRLIDSGMSSNSKVGLGFEIQSNNEVSDDNSSEHSLVNSNDSGRDLVEIPLSNLLEMKSESLSEPNEMSKSRLEVTNEKDVSAPKSKEVEPSYVSHIKTPRQPLKDKAKHIKFNRKNWKDKMERGTRGKVLFTKKKCFVCGSLNHLIKDCDYYEKKMAREAEVKRVVNTSNRVAKPVWTNANRVNHANQFVPRSVQLNAGRPKLNSVRPNINTGRTNINSVRPKVNAVSPKVNAVSPKVNTVRSKQPGSAVKTSASYSWRNSRPNFNYNSGPTFIRTVNANGTSLKELVDRDGGSVTFGGSKGYISGKGKIRVGNLDFDSVSFVKELGHFNLFSISQICDKQHKVLFTKTECLVVSSDFKMPDENQILLKVHRHHNMYSFDMKIPSPAKGFACLIAKATSDESKLWHRRLGHINFKNLNKLVKGNLVRGLPSKVFKNDHPCGFKLL